VQFTFKVAPESDRGFGLCYLCTPRTETAMNEGNGNYWRPSEELQGPNFRRVTRVFVA
jgi:hypothetical protein